MNINSIIENIGKTVDTHCISEGKYTRWLCNIEGHSRNLGVNEYGCADAANILYTIGQFPGEAEIRGAWIKTLQDMQNAKTGWYNEVTHHPIHTTAHCTAALELFDAYPKYPFYALEKYMTVEGLHSFLESIKWSSDPWAGSHQPAGLYSVMAITGMASEEWKKEYFEWFWREADEKTGLWRRGYVEDGICPISHHMAGTFHYLFIHEYEHQPIRYPEKLIDSCINMYQDGTLKDMGYRCSFLEVDWVYCLNRATRQTSYKFCEVKSLLHEFAGRYYNYMNNIDWSTDDTANDLHMLFGAVCCLAELQQALPGELYSKKPLKLVLNRRPFI